MQRHDSKAPNSANNNSAASAGAAAAAAAAAAASGGDKNQSGGDDTKQQREEDIIVDPLVAALWGVVPITARLFPGDAKPDANPPDKQLLVPRQGFLIYHMDSLRAHFSPYAANIHSLWLSICDLRTGTHAYVPWHLPTHVIVDRVASRSEFNTEVQNWGKTFLPLVVYVHFTLPPALKKKQRADLAATPDTLLTLKDTPGIATLHMYRWLKEVYFARFGDLEGFEGESLAMKSAGLKLLRAARDNDPSALVGVRRDVQKRSALEDYPYCVVVHWFDTTTPKEKPQWRYKTLRVQAAGRTIGRVLPEIIPALDLVPTAVMAKDESLPVQYGAISVQGLNPILTTPFDVIGEMFQSVDLALHIVYKAPR